MPAAGDQTLEQSDELLQHSGGVGDNRPPAKKLSRRGRRLRYASCAGAAGKAERLARGVPALRAQRR